jgi:hypothetical protein
MKSWQRTVDLVVTGDGGAALAAVVDAVGRVVVRHARTARLSAVNASAFLSCDERDELSGASDTCSPGSRAPRTSRTIQ